LSKKSYRLTGAPYEAAKAMHEEALRFQERLCAIQAEYANVSHEMEVAFGKHWRRILIAMGRPHADHADFSLDASYMSHGFLFLTERVPDEPEPLPGDEPLREPPADRSH
jgi:hypothetical protein